MNLSALITDWRTRSERAHRAGALGYAVGLQEAANELEVALNAEAPGGQVTGMFNQAFDQDAEA